MTYPNIDIDSSVISLLKSDAHCLIEVTGLPDAGSTSSVLKLLTALVKDTSFGLYLGSQDNYLHPINIRNILGTKEDSIIIAVTDYNDQYQLLSVIDKLKDTVDYIVIDDFAKFILHKNRFFLSYIMRSLRNTAELNAVKIIIVNQYRYNIEISSSSEFNRLYQNYIDPYIDIHLKVTKNDILIQVSEDWNLKPAGKNISPLSDLYKLLGLKKVHRVN